MTVAPPRVPFVTASGIVPGRAERLSPRITRVVADNPGPFTYTGSGTYLVGDEEGCAIIDPGPDDPAHAEAVRAAAPGPVAILLVTHTHRDHCGNARRLAALTGATVAGAGPHPRAAEDAAPALDEGADLSFAPDRVLRDGDTVCIGNTSLDVVATPGHCANHLCFGLAAEGALFTGDHVMGWSTSVVAPPEGDMAAYLDSLSALLKRPDRVYYPTHGDPIQAPHPFVTALLAHRAWRDRRILTALGTRAPLGARDLVPHVYDGLPPALSVAAALTVEAHCRRHLRLGTLTRDELGRYRMVEPPGG